MAVISSQTCDGVALWTLSNPPVNAVSLELLNELEALLNSAETDLSIRSVVIAAAGPAFAAGADIQGFMKLGGSLPEFMRKGAGLFTRLEKSRLPIVAAVNGVAFGGGNELAMACDVRIASTRARFGQPEVNLGIIPGWGGTSRLPRLVGLSHARRILLSGDPINADEAWRIGLVDKVVEPALVVQTAMNLADRLAALPPLALAEIKSLLAPESGTPQERETAAMERLMVTQDAMEGVRAFMAHRRPRFTGQ